MPLVRCRVCGKKVADDADACAQCGSRSFNEPIANGVRLGRYLGRAVLILLVVVVAIILVRSVIGLFPKNELPKGPNPSQNRR